MRRVPEKAISYQHNIKISSKAKIYLNSEKIPQVLPPSFTLPLWPRK